MGLEFQGCRTLVRDERGFMLLFFRSRGEFGFKIEGLGLHGKTWAADQQGKGSGFALRTR